MIASLDGVNYFGWHWSLRSVAGSVLRAGESGFASAPARQTTPAVPTPTPRRTSSAACKHRLPTVATPTPTPSTETGPYDRIAPTLGEPPPPPRLKPTPTPTPPTRDRGRQHQRINAELVQLHVRVIDRNNQADQQRARKTSFTFSKTACRRRSNRFTREEVPISYGLAVDTSGSLRSQLQSVIDAGKTIINSNKSGRRDFSGALHQQRQDRNCPGFHGQQRLADGWSRQFLCRGRPDRDHRCGLSFSASTFLNTGKATKAIAGAAR